jgi:hypothetical protein
VLPFLPLFEGGQTRGRNTLDIICSKFGIKGLLESNYNESAKELAKSFEKNSLFQGAITLS